MRRYLQNFQEVRNSFKRIFNINLCIFGKLENSDGKVRVQNCLGTSNLDL